MKLETIKLVNCDMKTNNIFKGLCLALAACASLAVTSCKDEPDAYEIQGGKPTINFIRPVSVEAKDSIITAASMRSSARASTALRVWM